MPDKPPVCSFFLRPGGCRYGKNCFNLHPGEPTAGSGFNSNNNAWNRQTTSTSNDSKASSVIPYTETSISNDLDPKSEKPTWPLSSYGPAKFEPQLIKGFDESPEELRWKAVTAQQAGNINQYLQYETNKIAEANRTYEDVRNNVAKAYAEASKNSAIPAGASASKSVFGSGSTFPSTSSAFGNTSTTAPSAFGNTTTPSVFGSNTTPSAFGSTTTPSAFASTTTPSAFGNTSTPSAFGTPANTTTTSVFGKPASVHPQHSANQPLGSQHSGNRRSDRRQRLLRRRAPQRVSLVNQRTLRHLHPCLGSLQRAQQHRQPPYSDNQRRVRQHLRPLRSANPPLVNRQPLARPPTTIR
ncbi:hypothetical protein NLJ89_g11506 [Agrocybe chaxingu]|uniref:C3H1-type domain-containing protein n=1 Tax=Agrocybe chaxingu TaxID=84603 RepID=A0A9W8JW66_9AGAR|nr:hypothetical protein NLJ89_g11506 [Agrocybe chaxingu]